jgi:hypothetical protein
LSVTEGLKADRVVSFFLESGHPHANEALQFIEQFKVISTTPPAHVEIVGCVGNSGLRFSPFKIGVIGLGSKHDMMPLQAADILAYCSLCLLKNPNDGFAKAWGN